MRRRTPSTATDAAPSPWLLVIAFVAGLFLLGNGGCHIEGPPVVVTLTPWNTATPEAY